MKIAIILRIESKLEKKINNLKNLFKKKHNNCLYVDDFPHITLFTANINLRINELKKINYKIKFKNVKISLSKPKVFRNDILTGGQTFFFEINKNRKLFDLQLNASNFFKKYLKKTKIKNKFIKNSLESKSFDKYGFPYVGKHWIPHVSICSVLDEKINKDVYIKFMRSKFNSSSFVNDLFICVVKKNNLIEVKKIKFAN